jgi:uncharacterized phage protein gp47/JayE
MSTTAQIKDRIVNAIVHELKKIDSTFENDALDKSVEEAVATALAGQFKLVEKDIELASRQGCPLTADSKTQHSNGSLEDWGVVKIARQPNPATPGQYTITITGTGTVTAGTQYIDDVTEFVYVLQSDVICAGTGTGTVKAVGEGSETVLAVGSSLFAQQKFDGIEDEVIVATVAVEPVDAEDYEDYRDVIVGSFRTTPRGGAIGDYIVWALEVTGVFKVFPYVSSVPTEGLVYIQAPQTTLNPTGIADSTLLTAVKAYLTTKEPMTTGETSVYSVIERAYVVDVVGLTDSTKESAVETALEAYFAGKYPFIDGVDDETLRTDRVTLADIYSVVYGAIGTASVYNITLTANAVSVTDEYLPAGNVGAVTVTFSMVP